MATDPGTTDATVAECLQIGHGFHGDERDQLVEVLNKLDRRLVGEPADRVRLDLMMKDRDGRDQKTTAELHIVGLPMIVGTSSISEVWAAVAEVRDEVLRQLDDEKKKHQHH
jgi:ribosome-associated translation inhibitor RaiA